MHTRTFQADSDGAVTVDLRGYDSDIEVVADPNCTRGYVEVYTEATSGPSVRAIDELPPTRGQDLMVRLPESGVGGGVSVVSTGRGFSSTMISGGGDATMVANGQRIEVRGGRTYVNGVDVTSGAAGGPGEGPATPIHFRAVVPYGSTLKARTYSGRVVSREMSAVQIKTYSGDVRATGLAEQSRIKTYSGDVIVGAAAGRRPAVEADTYSGDIVALDDEIRLRPKTYSGRVRYPS